MTFWFHRQPPSAHISFLHKANTHTHTFPLELPSMACTPPKSRYTCRRAFGVHNKMETHQLCLGLLSVYKELHYLSLSRLTAHSSPKMKTVVIYSPSCSKPVWLPLWNTKDVFFVHTIKVKGVQTMLFWILQILWVTMSLILIISARGICKKRDEAWLSYASEDLLLLHLVAMSKRHCFFPTPVPKPFCLAFLRWTNLVVKILLLDLCTACFKEDSFQNLT